MQRLRARLVEVGWLRSAVQALRLMRVLRPRRRFAADLMRGREGSYRAPNGVNVRLRPRWDLQVAREHLSKSSYQAPSSVGAVDPSATLDLGANIGLFTLAVLRSHPTARVVAVEPDEDNLRLLRANLSANGLAERAEIHPAAAGAQPGEMRFVTGRHHLSHAAAPDEQSDVSLVPVIDVMPLMAAATFVKIDIEGGEWSLLRDRRLHDVTATIAMEWHRQGSGVADPHAEASSLLRGAGFRVHHEESGDLAGFIWAWRPVGGDST